MVNQRFLLFSIAIFIIVFLITFILHILFKKNRFVKYLPALFFLVLCLYNYYLSAKLHGTFEDLGRIVIVMILFVGFVSNLISGLSIDLIISRLGKGPRI